MESQWLHDKRSRFVYLGWFFALGLLALMAFEPMSVFFVSCNENLELNLPRPIVRTLTALVVFGICLVISFLGAIFSIEWMNRYSENSNGEEKNMD